MNKKITNLFLAGALVVGLAGVAVSCTDYDDDINKLQEQVNAANSKVNDLTTQVANLQAAINAGAVITNVETVAAGKDSELPNGGVIVTLSDGKKFKVANGANGTNGKDGEDGEDGTIVTIGEDGFWYIDGKKTEYKAAGKDGADGKDADQVWYAPDTDKESATYGKWVKYTLKAGETTPTAEPTEDSWLTEGAANVVLTDDYLVITCVDENGEEVVVKVTLSVKLASLVFVPQVYVDGVEAMDAPTFSYTALDSANFDTQKEVWDVVDGADTTITPALVAKYHINPANAVLSADAEYSFVLNQDGNTPFVVTRTQAEGLVIAAEYAGEEVDTTGAGRLLKINVNIAGTPASGDYISVVALKYADADTTVVSDYATIYSHDIEDLVIADPDAEAAKKGLVDEHYRTILGKWNSSATTKSKYAPWSGISYDGRNGCDTTVAYNGKLDLAGIVAAHTADDADVEYTSEELEALGLTWDFSIVKGYKVAATEEFSEDEFAEIDGTELTAVNGLAAIGHSPIVRVKLMEGEKVVKVAYIKVKITGVPVELKPVNVEGENIFSFDCEASIDSVTFADLMENVVEPTGYSYPMFTDTIYTEFKAMPTKEVADSVTAWFEAEDSCVYMQVVPEYLFNHSGEKVELAAKFYNAADTLVAVEVLLTAKIEEVAKTFDLSSAKGDYINEYWWGPDRENAEGYDLTKFNVNVPDVGETDSNKCQFVNDLNAAFVTKDGKTVLSEDLTGLKFFFCEDVKNIKKIAEQAVEFAVVDDTVLVATAIYKDIATGKNTTVTKDTIAVINNSGEAVPYNFVTYNKESDLAKLLLNTDAMYTFIGAQAYLCENENMPVEITFDGEDHFRGDFIRPVYIVNETPEFLVDAVDYGEKYSYIDIAGLVSPYDWRARNFADYENYWDYYGDFEISVNVDDITCDLNGKKQAVPATIVLEQQDKPGHEYGVLSYKNNGNNVSTFHLFVPVTVKYGWGYIQTDAIKVTVYGTLEEIPTK